MRFAQYLDQQLAELQATEPRKAAWLEIFGDTRIDELPGEEIEQALVDLAMGVPSHG